MTNEKHDTHETHEAHENNGPDGGYGWVVLMAATLSNFINDGILLSFGIMLVELSEVFDASTVSVAAIPAIQIAITGLVSPVAGSLADEFGKRHVTIVGSCLFAGGLLTSSWAQGMGLFYITYGVLGGMGIGLMYGPVAACVAEHFTRRRTLASGIAFCGSGIGIFTMTPVINILLENYGWRGTFMILSGLELNCIACGFALLPPVDEEEEKKEIVVTFTIPKTKAQMVRHFLYYIPRMLVIDSIVLLGNFRGSIFFLSVFFYGLSINVPYSFIPKQAVSLGMAKAEASWLSSSLGISNTVSRVALGWLGDRAAVSRTVMLKCILLMTGVMLPLSLAVTPFEGKLVTSSLIGILLGGYVALFPAILVDIYTVHEIGKAVGLFMFVLSEAAVAGTLIAGWTVDVTGDFNWCFVWGGAGCICSALILMLPLAKDKCMGLPFRNQTTHF